MTKVNNSKTKVPATIEMNDENYLYDILLTEKSLVTNMVNVLNETSNQILYDKLDVIFMTIKQRGRDLFELMFKNGWYVLESAEQTKINEKITEFQTKIDELSN